jgi:hypothetical protein
MPDLANCDVVQHVLTTFILLSYTTAGYSALRETFLKLLRPGADYKAAFQKVLQRRQQALRRKENAQGAMNNY